MELEPESPGDLHDGREAWVAVGRQRFVEPFATHADPAGELADVAGARDGAERLGDGCGVVPGLVKGRLQVRSSRLDIDQVIGAVISSEIPLPTGFTSPGLQSEEVYVLGRAGIVHAREDRVATFEDPWGVGGVEHARLPRPHHIVKRPKSASRRAPLSQ